MRASDYGVVSPQRAGVQCAPWTSGSSRSWLWLRVTLEQGTQAQSDESSRGCSSSPSQASRVASMSYGASTVRLCCRQQITSLSSTSAVTCGRSWLSLQHVEEPVACSSCIDSAHRLFVAPNPQRAALSRESYLQRSCLLFKLSAGFAAGRSSSCHHPNCIMSCSDCIKVSILEPCSRRAQVHCPCQSL